MWRLTEGEDGKGGREEGERTGRRANEREREIRRDRERERQRETEKEKELIHRKKKNPERHLLQKKYSAQKQDHFKLHQKEAFTFIEHFLNPRSCTFFLGKNPPGLLPGRL